VSFRLRLSGDGAQEAVRTHFVFFRRDSVIQSRLLRRLMLLQFGNKKKNFRFPFVFRSVFVILRPKERIRTMDATATRRKRTREEVLAWLDAARQRKAAFQKETNEWWQARQRGLKEAAESGY